MCTRLSQGSMTPKKPPGHPESLVTILSAKAVLTTRGLPTAPRRPGQCAYLQSPGIFQCQLSAHKQSLLSDSGLFPDPRSSETNRSTQPGGSPKLPMVMTVSRKSGPRNRTTYGDGEQGVIEGHVCNRKRRPGWGPVQISCSPPSPGPPRKPTGPKSTMRKGVRSITPHSLCPLPAHSTGCTVHSCKLNCVPPLLRTLPQGPLADLWENGALSPLPLSRTPLSSSPTLGCLLFTQLLPAPRYRSLIQHHFLWGLAS